MTKVDAELTRTRARARPVSSPCQESRATMATSARLQAPVKMRKKTPLPEHTIVNIKQRPCRCLRSITDESLVLIELMIQLRCWGTEVLFTAPRASPRAGLGGNGPRQPSADARATQYSTVRTIQHTCKSSINRACVRRAVLSFLSSSVHDQSRLVGHV